ncbi:MAG: polysaccharide deacetylase [Candidatus Limivivens sp.]|nr:polysaccharide deacetylase [Candidatus Limivivens sp.]
MDYNERKRRAEIRRRKRKRQVLIGKIIITIMLLLVIALCVILVKDVVLKNNLPQLGKKPGTEQGVQGQVPSSETEEEQPVTETVAQTEEADQTERLIAEADLMAAQYDYDRAIEHLKNSGNYAGNTRMEEAVAEYENTKASCVEYSLEEVTHVFYHTLIYDTSKAFDGDSKEGGYNQVMTTISEFNKITQSMYDRGYVMVSLHDMCIVNDDGTVSRGTIRLPQGKKPFVLSQDDVSYYHYMDGDGMATKLIIDENGEVKNEYVNDDGSISVGDYDMIPLIDTFVKEHPDFSYRGAKGVIALTGYNGILGYRTDIAYKTGENLDDYQRKWLDEHPDFDFEQECQEATKVADAMKASGWEFASHTWGHLNVTDASLERLQTDTQKWMNYVSPLVGGTDIIIFSFGADLGSWEPYTTDNEKFNYMKSQGFSIFCNVDSSQYWVQFGNTYMRQGRRNLDGYRMYYNPDMLSDLFDVSEVWDSSRPTPVPAIG